MTPRDRLAQELATILLGCHVEESGVSRQDADLVVKAEAYRALVSL